MSHSTVKSGSLLIDSSTIDPAVSKEVDIIAQTKGATFMDAPVSGGQSMCNIYIFLFFLRQLHIHTHCALPAVTMGYD